jgi:toxin ParE1/3/4
MSIPERRLIISPEARDDVRTILRATARRWCTQQRTVYRETLDTTMRALLTYPLLGRSRGDLSIGLRMLPVEAHAIFYRVNEQAIIVVRVLHGHADASAHIAP